MASGSSSQPSATVSSVSSSVLAICIWFCGPSKYLDPCCYTSNACEDCWVQLGMVGRMLSRTQLASSSMGSIARSAFRPPTAV